MKQRLLTAAIGIPFLVFTLWVRGWFAELVIVALTVCGLWECYNAFAKAGYHACPWGGYAAAALMWPLSLAMGVLNPLMLVVAAMGVSMTGVLLSREPRFEDAAVSVYPLFTCLLPFSMLMMMMNDTYGKIPGLALVILAFAIAFACDISAYFGGRTLGRHKLCPTVSPKKTVEGAIAGLIGGTLCSVLTVLVCRNLIGIPMPGIPAALAIGIVGAAAGQIGDLTASLLKRHAGLKDYGNLFPGHGGVMDRFDSLIFTLIVVYCYVLVL